MRLCPDSADSPLAQCCGRLPPVAAGNLLPQSGNSRHQWSRGDYLRSGCWGSYCRASDFRGGQIDPPAVVPSGDRQRPALDVWQAVSGERSPLSSEVGKKLIWKESFNCILYRFLAEQEKIPAGPSRLSSTLTHLSMEGAFRSSELLDVVILRLSWSWREGVEGGLAIFTKSSSASITT